MTKENIYYMDDNAFDRFYKRARYQANSFVAGKLGSKAADYLTTLPDFAYLICKLMLDPDVPSSRKLDLGFALLYVLSPLDLVPDRTPSRCSARSTMPTPSSCRWPNSCAAPTAISSCATGSAIPRRSTPCAPGSTTLMKSSAPAS